MSNSERPIGSAMIKLLENQQLIQFLMGLNDVYVAVRANILMTYPMPQIGQALSEVSQEERQRELQTFAPLLGDSSALFSQNKSNSIHLKHYSSQPYSSP